jgi:hypothetical protein
LRPPNFDDNLVTSCGYREEDSMGKSKDSRKEKKKKPQRTAKEKKLAKLEKKKNIYQQVI